MKSQDEVLITFVLPCYNVERFVQLCLDSIYAIDLPESRFEVLCINDCSPDNIQQVLELNQKKHSNLRVFVHEHNKRQGGARNTGIREARGKYLWFVDPDDAITAPRLSEMLQKADDNDLDLLCFNHRRIDLEGNELPAESLFQNSEVLDGFSFAESAFGHCGIIYYMMFVWQFIYRTDYIRSLNLFFPEHVAWEETVFVSKTILKALHVASFADVMYSYRHSDNSTNGSFWRSYPAKLIYDHTFPLGSGLLRFSNEIKDESLKEAYRKWAISDNLNNFAVFLFRTSSEERKKFYQMVKKNKAEVEEAMPFISAFNKMLLLPFFGPFFAAICSVAYKWTH